MIKLHINMLCVYSNILIYKFNFRTFILRWYLYSRILYIVIYASLNLLTYQKETRMLNIMVNFYLQLNNVRNILLIYIWQFYVSNDGLLLINFIIYLYAISLLLLFKFTLKTIWKLDRNIRYYLRLIKLINCVKYMFYLSHS